MNPFEKYFPKQAENIKNCTQLSSEQKEDFFNTMKHISGNKKATGDAAVQYFRQIGRKLCGAIIKLEKETQLGRMHQWENIEHLIEKCRPDGDYEPSGFPIIKSWKERFSSGDPKIKRNIIEEILEILIDLKAPSPPVIWAFLFYSAEKLFYEKNLVWLPCQLGLNNMEPDDYLPLELKNSPSMKAKKPTAFDAELDEFWCPGGLTRPREKCSDKKGLKELLIGGYIIGTAPDGLNMWQAAKSPDIQ